MVASADILALVYVSEVVTEVLSLLLLLLILVLALLLLRTPFLSDAVGTCLSGILCPGIKIVNTDDNHPSRDAVCPFAVAVVVNAVAAGNILLVHNWSAGGIGHRLKLLPPRKN